MKWATFTGAFPGVDVTVGHYQPWGLVSWTWAIDPYMYTFYVPQTTIAAKREPFEIASLLRVQVPLRSTLSLQVCLLSLVFSTLNYTLPLPQKIAFEHHKFIRRECADSVSLRGLDPCSSLDLGRPVDVILLRRPSNLRQSACGSSSLRC